MNPEETPQKPDFGKLVLNELNHTPSPQPEKRKRGIPQSVLIPLLAVLTGLIFGAIFIILTSQEVYTGFGQSLGAGFAAMWDVVARSYNALFTGALVTPCV